ncbi:MAG: carbon-nitrogen hydrolase family protein [Solirubrobacteraceae bacterium]|nr:carbon-nitrogen hydrolase family protein [Solirubrobacteraceae bacterium]
MTPGDVAATARAHAESVLRANARLVVFPELSLTGYELDAPAVALDDPALAPLIAACGQAGTLALAGAPVEEDGARSIATLWIDGDGARIAYRKSFLGGEEVGRFAPGPGATALDVDGWRVGVGICKDTGVVEHVRDTAALGIDLYVAGIVHLPEELEEQERRARTIAAACGAPVALASFAGATGHGYDETAAESAVWSSDGVALARAGDQPGGLAVTRLTASS